jgi:MYXO-CTERM domain-containing protein
VDPCGSDELRLHHKTAEPVRLAVYCALRRNFLWDQGGDASQCGVLKEHEPNVARRCIFDSAADLLATVNSQDKDGVLALWPSEEQALRAAAETLPPPPMFRWFESSLLGGLAGFVVLLFTKGVSVYGLQVTAPLRALLGSGKQDQDNGKEAAGTIERYRAEFGLLCDALGGRLVIFIDDLDRCTPATVNGVLEMTNYLVDVGRCFVVIGAAMDRVARAIKPPVEGPQDPNYANEYLRKLVHVEMPVPLRRAELETLLRERAPAPVQGAASRWQAIPWRAARRTGLALAGLASLAAIFALGAYLHTAGDGVTLKVVQRPLTTALVNPGPGPLPPLPGPTGPTGLIPPTDTSDVGLNTPPPPHRPWPVLALGLLVIAAGFAWRWMRRKSHASWTASPASMSARNPEDHPADRPGARRRCATRYGRPPRDRCRRWHGRH